MDDVGRAAREVIRTIEELRIANGGDIRHAVQLPGRRHAAHRDERADGRRGGGQGPRPDQGRQPHPGRRARSALARSDRGRVERRRAAHQGRTGRARRHRAPTPPRPQSTIAAPTGGSASTSSADLIDRLFATPTGIDVAEVAGFDAGRVATSRPTSSRSCGRAASRCSCATATDALVPLVRPVEAWGLRPRSKEQQFALDLLLRPGGHGGRARRHGRHGQDDPRARRRPRAGDGDQRLRQAERVPTGRAGGQGRARASCPAPSTRSSIRG